MASDIDVRAIVDRINEDIDNLDAAFGSLEEAIDSITEARNN